MNSYGNYKEGRATADYRAVIDDAAKKVTAHKKRVDSIHHAKIDKMFLGYCKKLADVMNKRYSIDTRVASILVAGPSNFPVGQKHKQNAARDRNMEEWNNTAEYLRKILSVGKGGISSDDKNATSKLKTKLKELEDYQTDMKRINAYFTKNKSLTNCPGLSSDTISKLNRDMANDWREKKRPYPSYCLTNNNANIRRIKLRIGELEKKKSNPIKGGWKFTGGSVDQNAEDNRLRILFDSKPDESTRSKLKSHGFRWSPKAGAWQRQLTNNAIYAAKQIL
ncbi:MAG: hypothetical protein PHI15_01790 [Methanomicrobium sp.]|nr:hypothetical protein [Methanomicrobium sp.]